MTGELLSANMFSYCKNNPTTLKDPSGFRPIYTAGEETDAMREASLATMSKTNINNYQNRSLIASTNSQEYRQRSRDRERYKNPLRSRGAKKGKKVKLIVHLLDIR